MKGSDFMM